MTLGGGRYNVCHLCFLPLPCVDDRLAYSFWIGIDPVATTTFIVRTIAHINGSSMRILIIEDEDKAADYLRQGLTESGYAVERADSGIDGLHMALQTDYSLILLDVNLPTIDGWEVLEMIRRRKQTRVIMLTAHGRLEEKVRGLELGADDYLVKPFQFPELLARIRTQLKRSEPVIVEDRLCVADLELDPCGHKAFRAGQRINLTSKEFALLHLLLSRKGEVLTRTEITSLIWDMNFDSDTNVVEVAIRRLRVKIDEPFENPLIHTIRGVGYMLEEQP